jgi:uncharacterized protein (DUF4415 family)
MKFKIAERITVRIASSQSAKRMGNATLSSIRRVAGRDASSQQGRQVAVTEENIRSASLAEIRRMKERGETRSRPDASEGPELGTEFWDKAELVAPGPKRSVHLRVDADVFDWFKAQGPGHLSRMNSVLRTYYEAKRRVR